MVLAYQSAVKMCMTNEVIILMKLVEETTKTKMLNVITLMEGDYLACNREGGCDMDD